MNTPKIIASGLTGTELTALEWAFENGLACGGWCPKNWPSKEERLGMRETVRSDPLQAIDWNIWESDGMIIYGSVYEPSGVCFKAIDFCKLHRKPWIQLPLDHRDAVSKLTEFLYCAGVKNLCFVGSSVNEDEMKSILPLILSDTYSSGNKQFPLAEYLHGSSDVNTSTINLNPTASTELSFEDLHVAMYRTWEGRNEFASQVEANVNRVDSSKLKDPISFHTASIWACLTQNNPTEAANHLQQIPELLREHSFFSTLAENVYMANRDWEKLDFYTKQQIELQPNVARLWAIRGIALDKMGHTQVAYDLLLDALKRMPNEFNLSYNLACFACKLGREDEAWEWVQKAFQLGDLEVFKRWLLTDDDLKPLRDKIFQLSQTKLV